MRLECKRLGVEKEDHDGTLTVGGSGVVCAPRVVLVGNAAQSLHPVAGQGFNLGLRDAWELAQTVRDACDPGNRATLNAYFSERRFDRTATILFTDTLIRLFSNNIPIIDRLCGAGLAALSSIPPAKNFLVRRMMFGARG